jgi:hypothetical protein
MGWLDKIFGRADEEEEVRKEPETPLPAPGSMTAGSVPYAGIEAIHFGRYNDNNKSYAKTQRWYAAEDLFKEKKYSDAFAAFFDYIRDEEADNVRFRPAGEGFTFELIQGSKKIYGTCDGAQIVAHAPLAIMETPGTAVMRRLLDLNYGMYYTRCAMNEEQKLCMMFDSTVPSASPNKLYYGLRELATKADRQDDLLLADFPALKPAHTDHMQPVPETELEVKYAFFRKWIQEALDKTALLNADSFSGAIAYEFLTLLYRIDYLMTPEAKLLAELERISALYWEKKDEIPLIERNQKIKDALRKLLNTTREEFAAGMYRTTCTFGITTPAPLEKVKENILSANKDAQWYVENKYPHLAPDLAEYGVVYSNYAYSMPLVLKELSTVFMAVLHAAYFKELGMREPFYLEDTKQFNRPAIEQAVDDAIRRFPNKYKSLRWDHNKVSYESLFTFATSFSDQMAHLNLELKK